jgi:hypothetical protein
LKAKSLSEKQDDLEYKAGYIKLNRCLKIGFKTAERIVSDILYFRPKSTQNTNQKQFLSDKNILTHKIGSVSSTG